ncbi:MAG TPA: sigma-70 family RNA polymerase sigma factor [Kofleriaceae bacterium]|nr:sigma-70 family RNA polymerase sigma factor [Kofleriaceae bacterium]
MREPIAGDGGDAIEPSDAELVRGVVAGERIAFERIYRRHADAVFALLTRLIGPDREREDLLQETFIRLHPALGRFRGECALRTFVFQIATRVAIDHLRRRRRTPTELDDFDLDGEIDPRATPVEQAQRREQLARAVEVLGKLRPKLRVAFVLREVMDLSHEEVARIVDARPAAARMRVALAKRAIAKLGRHT